jgi:protein-S-isoprenylcysteine O-methyltransferase Ste14
MAKIEIAGKTPINKYIYFSGKFSAYLSWFSILVQFLGYNLRMIRLPELVLNASLIAAAIGFLIGIIAMFNLGNSMRFGLPSGKTEFKTGGLYSLSRNPIYVGFDLISLASMVYTSNIIIVLLGLYGIYTHYLITLAEEKFLAGRFGSQYQDYCKRVGRYL